MTKSGFVSILGRPNVGKSTLMNMLIGQKIAITSYKPQTTRNRIRTIYTDERGQIVFLDTPGVHTPKDRLGEYMFKAAESTVKEADLVLWLVEPKKKLAEEDRLILQVLAAAKKKTVLVITKRDTVKKAELLPVMEFWNEQWKNAEGGELTALLPVSARTREGLPELMDLLYQELPEGEPFYDEEMVTTETERTICQEIIREKALRLLQEEVPHGIAVQILRMKEREGKAGTITDIDADIIAEREAHKGIIIGAGGSMLKRIGTDARTDMENLLGTKVNLKLFVKVRKDWKDNESALKTYGYNRKDLQ